MRIRGFSPVQQHQPTWVVSRTLVRGRGQDAHLSANKPRGLQAARKLRTSRRENRWADKNYKKRALGKFYKTSPTGGSSHAKGIVLEKVSELSEIGGTRGCGTSRIGDVSMDAKVAKALGLEDWSWCHRRLDVWSDWRELDVGSTGGEMRGDDRHRG